MWEREMRRWDAERALWTVKEQELQQQISALQALVVRKSAYPQTPPEKVASSASRGVLHRLNGRHRLTCDRMMSFTDSLTNSPNSRLSRASPCRSSSLWMQGRGLLLFKPLRPLDRQLPPAQQQISK